MSRLWEGFQIQASSQGELGNVFRAYVYFGLFQFFFTIFQTKLDFNNYFTV